MSITIKLRWQNPTTGAMEGTELSTPIAIGKEPSALPPDMNHLVLRDGSVSRYHACIIWTDHQLLVRDQGSTNGVLVNTVKVSETELTSGDRLQIGRYILDLSFRPPKIIPTNLAPLSSPTPTLTLTWQDPNTGQTYQQVCTLPIAIGREIAKMPTNATPIVLNSLQVSRFHALITADQGQIVLTDQNSKLGCVVNGQPVQRTILKTSDVIKIGSYELVVGFYPASAGVPPTAVVPPSPTVLHTPSQETLAESEGQFPPACFALPVVAVQDLFATGLPVVQATYGAIGGGLGSYIWADYLRIGGVPISEIIAIGLEEKPYARYQRLCENSQIPAHERLRSNSDSCPDNIWGYPSYGWREAWRNLRQGNISHALYCLWQVFAEPILAETYTPKSGDVYASIEREAQRIGWGQMYRYGRVRAIRKTNDGRYAIAYSLGNGQHGLLLAPYTHLALGYPAIQFLPDLQEYRERTGDFQTVVNAYEDHHHVYDHLEQHGGTVILRGRGIVASRIIQRLYESRHKNRHISILHLMRSPKPKGNQYGRARRRVENHVEFQSFNWPKACWGGDLLELLAQADPSTRQQLLSTWGGTTTAARADWRRIIKEGLAEGWYQITFGEVERVEPIANNQTITTIRGKVIGQKTELLANFIIDATGLDAQITTNPLFADLVDTYNLPLNFLGRLSVHNDFSVVGMENGKGRMYAAGAATLGGPHAAVDSFLGLQYACLAAVDSLYDHGAPHLHKINGLYSLSQWWKWVMNAPPCCRTRT